MSTTTTTTTYARIWERLWEGNNEPGERPYPKTKMFFPRQLRVQRFSTYSAALRSAPGRSRVPEPNPPPRMVREEAKPKGLRALIGKLFEGSESQPTFAEKQKAALKSLGGDSEGSEMQEKYKFLHTSHATNLLFWYCPDLTFSASDFARVGPPHAHFNVTRARNPINLTPWMGYFLEFKTTEEATKYYEETIGHELCGFPLKLKFVQPDIRGFKSPLLEKVPQVSRKSHALVLGLPAGYTDHNILRVLWDYDLLDDDQVAVERLPLGQVKYGGNPYLLRFKSEREAERFVRDHDGEVFPYTEYKVLCQVID